MTNHINSDLSWESRLSIVIPAFNEEDGIGATLADLVRTIPHSEIIVVDDGSDDRTLEVAANFPEVILVQHPFNRGYGAALKTGMTVASREFVAWFDADHEHRVDDLIIMIKRIIDEPVAAVIAQRSKWGNSPLRSWGKYVIRLLARSLSAQAARDMNCGLRVFRREVITRYLSLLPNGFSASITSLIILLERGYPMVFHNAETNKRIGSSKVTLADGFMALMLVLRIIMLFAPMRLFLRLGLLLVAIGITYGLAIAFTHGAGIPSVAVGISLSGVLVVLFGLTADQISQLRLAVYDEPIYQIKRGQPISKEATRLDPVPQVATDDSPIHTRHRKLTKRERRKN